MTVAPVSLCLIVKNEGPRLEACLKCWRPYVKEIIIVDTGSTDLSMEIALTYADRVERFLDCNDSEGRIENFAMARNYCFSLATQSWIMWCDADDLARGTENLASLISELELIKDGRPIMVLLPYEYAHDQKGNVKIRQFRERIFSSKTDFKWINWVHEVNAPQQPNTLSLIREDITWVHNRGNKIIEPGRNLRIIKKMLAHMEETGIEDARQYYYSSLEFFNNNLPEEAIKYAEKYLALSGWDDEKYMQIIRLCQHFLSIGDYQKTIDWALKALTINEKWCEGYLLLAKAHYLLATINKDVIRNYERCVHFAEIGLSLPPTQTLLFVDPMERNYEIHKYLNVAYSRLGKVREALDSCNLGLKANPDDKELISNQTLYQKHLSRLEINDHLGKMIQVNAITQPMYDSIMRVFDGGEVNSNYPSYIKSVNYPDGVEDNHFPIASVTPHAQAWGIPKDFELNDLPVRLTDEQLQAVTLLIWKEYILQDEILSAISFLEKAPYRVRNTAATERALNITNGMISWIKDMSLIQKHNSPAEPEREGGNPLPNVLINQEGGRFNLVRDRLKPKSSLVDFGCFDGCFTNRYGMLGHEVYGLDLVETSVKLANKKAAEFNTGAKHIVTMFENAADKVPNNYFNYATSTDTYEHLLDPVKEMLLPAKKMLNKEGKFLLVTPYGSWLRGNYCNWANPWLYGKEGIAWNAPMPRAHLIAPTAWSVAKDFRDAGYWVKDSYPVLCEPFRDVEGQGNVFCEAWLQGPKTDNPLDIVFYMGDGLEYYTPASIAKNGSGASESLLVDMSKRFSLLGHKVRVYAGVGPHGEGIYDGVSWYQSDKFQDLKCDILIVSRRADMLADSFNIEAKIKVLWCHDVIAVNATNALLLKADKIFALTEWHKQYLINAHNLNPEHIIVTRNGIDLNMFHKENIPRNKYKVVNCSSPDRSWDVLFDCWKEIKTREPKAELHTYYGLDNMFLVGRWDPSKKQQAEMYLSKIQELKDYDLHFHGRVNQEKLVEEMLSAGVWAYPNWFEETYSCVAASAQAAGLRCVCSANAALNEVVADRGVRIEGDSNSPEYKEKFIAEVVKAMQKEGDEDRIKLMNYAQENFGLDSLTNEWEKIFLNLIEYKKIHPIIKYQPVEGYK